MQDTIKRRNPANPREWQVWHSDGHTGHWVTAADHSAPIERPSEVAPMPALPATAPAATVRTAELLKGDHVTRAKAFEIKTRVLSFAFAGAGALLWFIGRWAFPKLNGADVASFGVSLIVAVLVGLSVFVVVWAGAYVLDIATSPGGIGFLESWRTQRRLDRQSDAMIEAFRQVHGLDD